jgi:hypothetical protein
LHQSATGVADPRWDETALKQMTFRPVGPERNPLERTFHWNQQLAACTVSGFFLGHEALLIEIAPSSDKECRGFERGLKWDCAG